VYVHQSKAYSAIKRNAMSMLKDVSRSQAAMCAIKVIISKKQCKILTLLENIHRNMAYS